MCNPRRIEVRATLRIAEAWRAEIERSATHRGDISGSARLEQNLGDLLPAAARLAFEQAMGGDPAWEWSDGAYRHQVAGGYTAYHPDTGELEILVELTTAVEVLGTARVELSGTVEGEVEGSGSGSYYSDGYAGMTVERARKAAQEAAEAKAAELVDRETQRRVTDARERALREADVSGLQAQAEEQAQALFDERVRAERGRLEQQAGEQLQAVQQETLRSVFRLVATGYAAALQQYAAAHGAQDVLRQEGENVITLEFEMEA